MRERVKKAMTKKFTKSYLLGPKEDKITYDSTDWHNFVLFLQQHSIKEERTKAEI